MSEDGPRDPGRKDNPLTAFLRYRFQEDSRLVVSNYRLDYPGRRREPCRPFGRDSRLTPREAWKVPDVFAGPFKAVPCVLSLFFVWVRQVYFPPFGSFFGPGRPHIPTRPFFRSAVRWTTSPV